MDKNLILNKKSLNLPENVEIWLFFEIPKSQLWSEMANDLSIIIWKARCVLNSYHKLFCHLNPKIEEFIQTQTPFLPFLIKNACRGIFFQCRFRYVWCSMLLKTLLLVSFFISRFLCWFLHVRLLFLRTSALVELCSKAGMSSKMHNVFKQIIDKVGAGNLIVEEKYSSNFFFNFLSFFCTKIFLLVIFLVLLCTKTEHLLLNWLSVCWLNFYQVRFSSWHFLFNFIFFYQNKNISAN